MSKFSWQPDDGGHIPDPELSAVEIIQQALDAVACEIESRQDYPIVLHQALTVLHGALAHEREKCRHCGDSFDPIHGGTLCETCFLIEEPRHYE